MRTFNLAITSLLLAGLVGCGGTSHQACERHGAQARCDQPVELLPPPLVQASYPPSMLFDRIPARYSATDFAYRSDWPSTNSYYAPGETIYYNMYSVEYDGPGFNRGNSSYRRFETQRVGTGYR